MGKVLAAALVAVICIDPVNFDGDKYAPGSTIEGLTPKQAEQLIEGGHAELVPADDEQAAGGDADTSSAAPPKPAAKKR